MYYTIALRDRVRVPPKLFGENVKEVLTNTIIESYEGMVSMDSGILLSLIDIKNVGEGTLMPGDGAIFYDTEFEMLSWKPENQEVVEGKITEIAEYGAFIRMGPVDGLVHISQTMDDFVSFAKTGSLQGKSNKRALKVDDAVRARIIAVSVRELGAAKIGLTMRQPGLGKLEWIEADSQKKEQQNKKEEKEDKKESKPKK
ncbi:MAG: DNA-directed RNA polymerase [Candidatus Nanoarchaeia archaeon]|nr:DNA-directed RNA polymerase [Candidatus Nanoarchaeia archaeon]